MEEMDPKQSFLIFERVCCSEESFSDTFLHTMFEHEEDGWVCTFINFWSVLPILFRDEGQKVVYENDLKIESKLRILCLFESG